MNVLLLQLDGKLPNLALMRIAAHHRAQGDAVELRAELREHRQAEEIQMRRGWYVTKCKDGKWRAWGKDLAVLPDLGRDTPKAALIAADEWMKQQEKGGA